MAWICRLGPGLAIGFLPRDAPALLILLPLNARSLRGRESSAIHAVATHLAAQSNLLRLQPGGLRLGERAGLTALIDAGLLICLALNDGLFCLKAK